MTFRKVICLAAALFVVASASFAAKLNDQWSVGFSERCRIETWDNTISMSKAAAASRTYTRTRTQLGAIWSPVPDLTLGLRLANEFRYYLTPTSIEFNLSETFIDNLYLKAGLPCYQPLEFTLGRQDIAMGEGFIILDGTPLDGSRSSYVNAVRADWTIRPDHQLTAFVCHEEETDDWLPVFHKVDQALIEQPETGVGVFYNGKLSQNELEGYFVFKRRCDTEALPINSTANTLGGRIKRPVASSVGLTAVAEAAYQFGEHGDADRTAFGGYGYLQYSPHWKTPRPYLPSSFTAGVIYLSGDNPKTGKWEGWDPMFARWPKWSDSYIYAEIKEDAVAWWTNLVSLNSEVKFALTPEVDFKLTYHHLMAPQARASSIFPGGAGTVRGELFIGKLSYKFGKYWSGHLLCESFKPGDYYFDGANGYAWMRVELMFQY